MIGLRLKFFVLWHIIANFNPAILIWVYIDFNVGMDIVESIVFNIMYIFLDAILSTTVVCELGSISIYKLFHVIFTLYTGFYSSLYCLVNSENEMSLLYPNICWKCGMPLETHEL